MSGRQEVLARLEALPAVSLAELDAAAALRVRTDHKHVLDWEQLDHLLAALAPTHAALELGGRRAFAYETVYFDSPDLSAFRAHLQGRRRRWKTRARLYSDAGECRFEVKLKGLRGETIKRRIPYRPEDRAAVTGPARAFLGEVIAEAYGLDVPVALEAGMTCRFMRLTLVALDSAERVTADFDLSFTRGDEPCGHLVPDRVIVETKSLRGRGEADRALRVLGARPTACSKYLAGVGLAREGRAAGLDSTLARHFVAVPHGA